MGPSVYRQRIVTDYHQFTISSIALPEIIPEQYPEFSLAVFGDEIVRVQVGVRHGPVDVQLEVYDQDPSYDDGDWEDVAEGGISYDSPEGLAVYNPDLFQVVPNDEAQKLAPGGCHEYRVRICVKGRGVESDGTVDEPVEEYLIQMWPSRNGEPAREIKNESGVI